MERSFINALATLKRNTEIGKYGLIDRVLDVIYGYYLRTEDEVPELVERYNTWAKKNGYNTVDLEIVLRNI